MRVDRCSAFTGPLPAGAGLWLPIVGRGVPLGFAQQISSQCSPRQRARNAGELTPAPIIPATRVQVRITRRHPMRRNFRTGANRIARGAGVSRRAAAWAPERPALVRGGPHSAGWKPKRPRVDTPRPSDMVENSKNMRNIHRFGVLNSPCSTCSSERSTAGENGIGRRPEGRPGSATMGGEATKSNNSQQLDFVPETFHPCGRNAAISVALRPDARGARVLARFARRFHRSESVLIQGSTSAARALHSLRFRSIHDQRNGW